MTALLLVLIALGGRAAPDRPLMLDAATDPYASAFVFVTTPVGLYAFNRTTATWTRYTAATGLPGNQLTALGIDEGIIWAGSASGIASADAKLGDWQPGPSGAISGIAFDRSYVWVTGDSGLTRFDKFAETWERIIPGRVNDVAVEKGLVWLATDSGILAYNPEFSRLETTPAPRARYDEIISTPARIWFRGSGGFAAFRRTGEDWSGYPGITADAWSAQGDSLFIISDGRVRLFDPGSGEWTDFRAIGDIGPARAVAASTRELVIATQSGLVTWNWAEQSRTIHNRNSGLTSDSCTAVYSDGSFLFALGLDRISLLDDASGIWKAEPLTSAGARSASRLSLEDDGVHLRPGAGVDLRLAGRASYAFAAASPFTAGQLLAGQQNVDLGLTGRHSDRSLSLYYNDADKDQVEYGLRYSGAERDILPRANAGRINSEYYEFSLVPEHALLGANARLSAGGQDLNLQAGRLGSARHTDYFTGREQDKAVRLRDADFARRMFYSIGGIGLPRQRGGDTIYVDDRDPVTNGPGTRPGANVNGIIGDWDVLVRGADYDIDYDSGIVVFARPRGERDAIVASLDDTLVVLQNDGTSRATENTYLLGPDIVPGSVELTITDTLGVVHPLSEFGLDNTAGFVNHRLGFLRFPAARPFPDSVYDDSLTVYTLGARYRTRATFYYLSARPVRKGSEAVTVDGEQLARGSDYVVDYTSGIVLFLRPDIVSDFSRIEIRYSAADADNKGLLLAAQPVIAVADGIRIAPGFTAIDSARIVHLSGKAETGSGRKMLRFVPQLACGLDGSLAQDHVLAAGFGIADLRAEFRGYSAGFADFGAAASPDGRLNRQATVSAGIEPLKLLRLDGGYSTAIASDTTGESVSTTHTQARLSYADPRVPNGYLLFARDRLADQDQSRSRAAATYEFEALRSHFRLGGSGQFVHVTPTAAGVSTGSSTEGIADAGFSLAFPLQANLRYRRSLVTSGGLESRGENELRCRVGFDAIPGLYYALSYGLLASGAVVAATRDVALAGSFYNDLQVSPGRWLSALDILNLSLGTGRAFDEYLAGRAADFALPALLFAPVADGPVTTTSDLASIHGTVQFDPLPNLMLRYRRSQNRSGTARYALPELRPTNEDEFRARYEPAAWGALTALYTRRVQYGYPLDRLNTGYLEWVRPWSRRLQTKLTASVRADRKDWSGAVADEGELRGAAQALIRFGTRSYITADLGAVRRTATGTTPAFSFLPGAGMNLNVFRFLYLQLTCSATLPPGGAAAGAVSGSISGQF